MKYLVFLFFGISFYSYSQETERIQHFNTKENIAIEGYDPVSYFKGKPLKGKKEFKSTFKGISYLFAKREHLNVFEKSPEKYEPQFGGWCAYAVGNSSEKVKIDPETYTIIEGKLYLFYNFFFTNTLELWKENEKELLKKSQINWKKMIEK